MRALGTAALFVMSAATLLAQQQAPASQQPPPTFRSDTRIVPVLATVHDADGRLDLVVSQNGAATRLFHNRGAKPGLRVRLVGPATNPDGVGAKVQVVYGDRRGPAREIHAGSGYWSQNGAVQVFGLDGTPTAVVVQWPGGQQSNVAVQAGAREVVVNR